MDCKKLINSQNQSKLTINYKLQKICKIYTNPLYLFGTLVGFPGILPMTLSLPKKFYIIVEHTTEQVYLQMQTIKELKGEQSNNSINDIHIYVDWTLKTINDSMGFLKIH